MISRLPRVLYRPLPDGQDWIVRAAGKQAVIVINEALGTDGRRQARRAAYAALRRGYPAWVPLPVLAAFGWISDKARSPLGSAVTASALTAAAFYAVTAPHGTDPPPIAGPVIITIQPTPHATEPRAARPHPSARRATHTRPPATPSGGQSSPARSTSSPPSRSDGPATPRASRTASPPTTMEAVQEAAVEFTATPSRSATEQADTPADFPSAAPTLEQAAAGCGGIGLDIRVDPVVDVDACLLG